MKPHYIRSVFSEELLYPPDWIKEMEELAYDEDMIIRIIELYELYLALIIRGLQWLHRFTKLSEWSDKKMEEAEDFVEKYSQNEIFNKNFYILKDFIDEFHWGAGKDRQTTINCYGFINELLRYCFFPKNKGLKINISKSIKIYQKRWLPKKERSNLPGLVEIFYFTDYEFVELQLLIEYFNRQKIRLQEIHNVKMEKKSLVNRDNVQNINILIMPTNQIINQIIEKTINVRYDNPEQYREVLRKMDDILSEIPKMGKKIIEESIGRENFERFLNMIGNISPLTEENIKYLIDKITKETFDNLTKNNEYNFLEPLHFNKLLFIVEFPSFRLALKKLVQKEYIDVKKDCLCWRYDQIKKCNQARYDLLLFMIFDISYVYDNPCKIEHLDELEEHWSIFINNRSRFEVLKIAFSITTKDNARHQDEVPKGYIDLLDELGLTSNIERVKKLKKDQNRKEAETSKKQKTNYRSPN
ncbi:MAG: hypothetical protein LBE13_01270 [Bacteroidales bacterium]|jgi:hypothetical protein|nr:hypothetical protein [Bacteroidales bacterium]